MDVEALHADSPVFLAYVNPPEAFLPDGGIDFSPFIEGSPHVQGSLPNYRAGGVKTIVVSFGTNQPQLFPGRASIGRIIQHLGGFMRAVAGRPDEIGIARQPGSLAALHDAGKLAVILHLTSAFLDGQIDVLHAYHALGVRSIHPSFDTVSQERPHDWKTGAGLTPLGRDVVRTMDELGMVIDLAHASEQLSREVLEMVDRPVIISHTMCRALVDTTRNTTDDLHRAVAEQGGVIGIHFAGQLIDERYAREIARTTFHQELSKWEEEMHRDYPDPFVFMANRYDQERWVQTEAHRIRQTVAPPAFDKVIDHIDHLVQTIGVDHVGLGTDYDLGNMPVEVCNPANLRVITQALADRGYDANAIRKILGGNFERVFES